MHVVNLPGLTTCNQAVISSEKYTLAKETTDTHISYTTNIYLQMMQVIVVMSCKHISYTTKNNFQISSNCLQIDYLLLTSSLKQLRQ